VWLLPGRSDHERDRIAMAQSRPERCGDRQRDGREHLPLRHVYENSQSDPQRRCAPCAFRRSVMSTSRARYLPDNYLPEYLQRLHAAAFEAPVLRRRGFIRLSGLAGGGLAIAFSIGPGARSGLAQTRATEQGPFTPNAYVQIRPDDTIVLFAKNPEIG